MKAIPENAEMALTSIKLLMLEFLNPVLKHPLHSPLKRL